MSLKIKKIEKVNTKEKAYDLTVDSNSHTFMLANGAFVHNSLKVPKQYLGCLRGDTKILLLNGQTRTIEYLYENKDVYVGKGIMAVNKDGSLQPTIINDIMLTKPSTSFLRIHLDNGEYVDVTPDHRMILRNGDNILAEDLSIGDSLMPYYDYIKEGRRYVLDNKLGKYKPQYRIVAESVCDIPKGYQVHHKNTIKIDDDFDNLVPLTVQEHYKEHSEMLHEMARISSAEKRAKGESYSTHQNAKMINNGIKQYWLHDGDELPVGYEYGMLPFTEEHRTNIGNALRGKPKNYDCAKNFGDDCVERSKAVKAYRQSLGLYDEQYKNTSERIKEDFVNKTGMWSDEAVQKRMERYPQNRISTNHYVRCLCCGQIEQIKCNEDWYNEYLNEDVFWFCSKECAKLNGGGKLGRSYKLFKSVNYDPEEYENIRFNGDARPDSYFRYSSLQDRLEYIENYVPECNHKVVDIEYIDVEEPAYDISVMDDCHTFALPCGIFVHNCTDDAGGFDGGTSLSLISSRYAKTVKRVQNVVIQMVTDIINILLVDKGYSSYINKYRLRMQEPTTREEADRKDTMINKITVVQDTMSLFDDIQDTESRLIILKNLLAGISTDAEILATVDNAIQAAKDEKEAQAALGGGDESIEEMPLSTGDNSFRAEPSEEPMSSSDLGTEPEPEESGSGELPTPEALGVDMVNM